MTKEIGVSFKLEYFRSVFNTTINTDLKMYLSQNNGICLTFNLNYITKERLKEKTTKEGYAIIVRIFSQST